MSFNTELIYQRRKEEIKNKKAKMKKNSKSLKVQTNSAEKAIPLRMLFIS